MAAVAKRRADRGREALDKLAGAPQNREFFSDIANGAVTAVTGVTTSIDAACAVTPSEDRGVTGVTEGEVSADSVMENRIPRRDESRFAVLDRQLQGHGRSYKPGVWWFSTRENRGNSVPVEQWVCSPLRIVAVTTDASDGNFGRLLRFRNTLGRERVWAMPMEMLRASGDDLRGELLAMGVEIDPGAHKLLGRYLQAFTPAARVQCAMQTGWCGDDAFVLPGEVIGPGANGVVYQTGERRHDEYTRAGTLDGWRAEVAARAVGNPVLVLALSAAFAGPLLKRSNAESGGIHLVGDSSTGKTTGLEAARSVWGGPNFRRSWRATANGMEGAAALFTDCLLALDEISECEPREVGQVVYALGNGFGKQRASRSGSARSVARWRCVVLSTGERTIGTAMAEGGYRAKAGQGVRLLDIPAQRRYGAWDNLHEFESGPALSDSLRFAAAKHYGHAGREFLRRLAHDKRDLAALLEQFKALQQFSATEGQDKRAAGRFALLALAGELAIEYGIVDWPQGEAVEAAHVLFCAWRSMRGGGSDERRRIAEQVSDFIAKHGDSRFSNADFTRDDQRINNRAGWWRDEAEGRVYLFNSPGLKEAIGAFDFKRGLDLLQEIGALPAGQGERAKSVRVEGQTKKLYPIQPEKLVGADEH